MFASYVTEVLRLEKNKNLFKINVTQKVYFTLFQCACIHVLPLNVAAHWCIVPTPPPVTQTGTKTDDK